jgi:DNA repair exonuclease SbcCD nuclease subunit
LGVARVLLLADTHLGFDLSFRSRVERRRRGAGFFANLERALEPALRREVDLVVHGGDLLYRSRVPPRLVHTAFAPLRHVANRGVPVVVVPGNHERSAIPRPLLAAHPRIFVFHHPTTLALEVAGLRLALTGLPHIRQRARQRFPRVLESTGWSSVTADARLICMHQCVEGATVGPGNYVFTNSPDVVRGSDIPEGFAAVLSGHIHRSQVLRRDLGGRRLAAPVFYPGSIERTSFAECGERKGYLVLELEGGPAGGRVRRWSFHQLPTRPMVTLELDADPHRGAELRTTVAGLLGRLPPDAVVRLRVLGEPTEAARRSLRADSLRSLAPASMNVSVSWRPGPVRQARRRAASTTLEVSADARRGRPAHGDGQLGLAGSAHAPHRPEA